MADKEGSCDSTTVESLNPSDVLEGTLHDYIQTPKKHNIATVADLYNNWTSTYEKDLEDASYQGPAKVSTILSEHCPNKTIKVLDCGAGTGLVGKELYNLGFTNIVGLDISPESLRVAEQKGVYKKLICAEVGKEAMPFNDNEFDALVCSGCILPGHMRPACFREWVRIVKPGGTIAWTMRPCYIQLVKGQEDRFSKDYQEEFDEVMRDLEDSKRWKILHKGSFPGYRENVEGLALVAKVLVM